MKRFMDPTSLKVLALVPLPTNGSLLNNFQGPVGPSKIRTVEVQGRIDYRISDRDSFYGRYIGNFNNDFVSDLFPSFCPGGSDRAYKRNRRNQNLSLADTHIFSSHMVHAARPGGNPS